jgi:Uma2 family endonuclease
VLFYPDVFVTCDRDDLRTDQVFTAPTVVVEVLSPSTQAYDRGQKFTWYRRLPSLREYLLVDPDTRELQLFRRGADGLFTLHDLTGAPQVELTSIGCTLPAEEVFDRLDPEAQAGLPGI